LGFSRFHTYEAVDIPSGVAWKPRMEYDTAILSFLSGIQLTEVAQRLNGLGSRNTCVVFADGGSMLIEV